MMNIFEQLNILLTESEGSKVKGSDIPIHPEMETKEQGKIAAAEKIIKLFQKLSMGSGSGDVEVKDSKPEIPDDMIDPMMKEAPKSSKDKTFEKNKLTGWDEKSDEKIKKEVEIDSDTKEDDEFDDFDYRNNEFGDVDDEDNTTDYDDDDRTEDEKLKDAIDDAIDSLNDNKDEYGEDGDSGDDSGADWGDEESDNGEEGGQQGGQQGGTPQNGEQQSGTPQNGEQNDNGEQGSTSSHGSSGGKKESMTQKQKRLEDLKKSLDSDDMTDFNEKMSEIKDATDVPEDNDMPGGQIETPSDEKFKEDMKKGGFDDKTIDEMTKKKNINSNDDYNEKEMEELKKKVVNGLEDACKKRGGSSLASTIVKNSLKRKINDEEWREVLKLFLKGKSTGTGNMSSSNKGIKWGHKNHLWRDAVLPTDGPSKGTIQTINCFIDFSGSVNQDLVFTFLGKVIDMCVELKYTKVKVYGFGTRLVEPRVIDKRTLKDGVEKVLMQTWEFISKQDPGGGTENFSDVAKEINRIKQKEKKSVFLIFGDAYWQDPIVGPKCLKYELMNPKYLDDICVLAYYMEQNSVFAGMINLLVELVGIKHIITTKASSIHE